MLLTDVITEYHLSRASNGYAANTRRNDEKILRFLVESIAEPIGVAELLPVHVDRYFLSRAERCSPSSLNVDLSTLKAFVKWCQGRGYLTRDPLTGRRWQKSIKPMKLFIRGEEFPRLLDAAVHPLERIVVATGLEIFTRASETRALRVGDVDLNTGRIVVTVLKTKERDAMAISDVLGTELERWLSRYAAVCGPLEPEWFLCPRKVQAEPYGRAGHRTRLIPTAFLSQVHTVVQDALCAAGYPAEEGSREGEHTLRRSGALRMYRELSARGHDNAIRLVSTALHHSSITMTEEYLDLRLDRVLRDQVMAGTRYRRLRAVS
jgi:integrase